MKKFTVALLYTLKTNAPHESSAEVPWDKWNELDSENTVQGYERALRAGGHDVIPLEGDIHLPERLSKYSVDICFNTCEGHRGASREAQVPAMLDMLGIPYTGSGVMALSIALDKSMTKRVLQFYGIPTPAFQVFISGNEPVDSRLTFPLFAKPAMEGSGIGITDNSICRTPRELRAQVKYLLRAYEEPVLVEEYIDGRELTAGLIGNLMPVGEWLKEKRRIKAAVQAELVAAGGASLPALPSPATPQAGGVLHVPGVVSGNGENKNGKKPPSREYNYAGVRVFPPMEVDFTPLGSQDPHLYNSEIKSKNPWGPQYLIPAPLSLKMTAQIGRLTVATFRALECADFCRVDFRIRKSDGQPFVIEINPLAGLTEGLSDLVLMANAAGMTYAELINGILDAGLKRYNMV